jgi:hypothetical protein
MEMESRPRKGLAAGGERMKSEGDAAQGSRMSESRTGRQGGWWWCCIARRWRADMRGEGRERRGEGRMAANLNRGLVKEGRGSEVTVAVHVRFAGVPINSVYAPPLSTCQ